MNAQPSLLDWRPEAHARTHDPATSKTAAQGAERFAKGHCKVILDWLKTHPEGGTIDDIAEGTGFTSVQVARRTADLEDGGCAWASEREARPLRSGKLGRVWRACR